MKFTTCKDTNRFVQELITQGWRAERGRHLKLLAPNGGVVFVSTTPSDHRAFKNMKSRCRQVLARGQTQGQWEG